MASGGRRTLFAVVCAVALVAVAAPAALSSSTGRQTTLATLDAGVLQQLNAVRVQHGLAPLRQNHELDAAAEQHSREMAVDGYFDHSSSDGTSFSTRIAHWYGLQGYHYWSVGENLLWSSPSISPAGALDLWMHSPDHRANILNPRWREIGIAAVHFPSAAGTYKNRPVTIITADFGFRR
jgi:uncharacterized protein YkwD